MRGMRLLPMILLAAACGILPAQAQREYSASRSSAPRMGHGRGQRNQAGGVGAPRTRPGRPGGGRAQSKSQKPRTSLPPEESTVSLTTLMAPKKAVKTYDTARKQLAKGDPGKARKSFEKAVRIYPKYAAAWYELGRLSLLANRPGEARTAYEKALAVDRKFWKTYQELAAIEVREQNWWKVAEITDTAQRVAPIVTAPIYVYSAMAKYSLGRMDEAERSARQAIRMNPGRRSAPAYHVLDLLLAWRADYGDAVANP